MMHKLKKAAHSGKAAENAEFADYKNRLDNLSNYLRSSSAALNASEQAWRDVCNRQKQFAELFCNRYPDRDQVREFSKESASASQALVKEFVLKTDGSTAAHWQIDSVVQDYLAEIDGISVEYKPVAEAAKEVTMYTKKVDDLQTAKKPDENKIGRNMEKLDDAKKAYEEILDRVVDKMKSVYNKRQVAMKATYVAYWSSQLRAFNLLDASLEPTRAFVEGSIERLSTLKIGRMSDKDVEEFVAEAQNIPTTPKSKKIVGDIPTSPADEKSAVVEG